MINLFFETFFIKNLSKILSFSSPEFSFIIQQKRFYVVLKNQAYLKPFFCPCSKYQNGDTILVQKDITNEGANINIQKSIALIGIGRPVLDGQMKYEIVSLRANKILLQGFKIINSGEDEVKNIGAVRLYDSQFSTIKIIFSRTITWIPFRGLPMFDSKQ